MNARLHFDETAVAVKTLHTSQGTHVEMDCVGAELLAAHRVAAAGDRDGATFAACVAKVEKVRPTHTTYKRTTLADILGPVFGPNDVTNEQRTQA